MGASSKTGSQQEETRIFVSYAREDTKWLDKSNPHNLIPYLVESLRRHNVTFWFDKELKGGDVFERHIGKEIDNSQIALLIVSQYFINSEFIENKEMPRIAERARQGKMIVVPVLVEPCDWNDYPFLADRQDLVYSLDVLAEDDRLAFERARDLPVGRVLGLASFCVSIRHLFLRSTAAKSH